LTDTVSKQILEHQAELEKQAEEAEKLYEKYTGENFAMFVSYPAGNIVENTNAIYDFLRNSLGLNHAAACGVLANIQCESNFTSTAIGDGGTSYGVCQWHLERFTRLIGWCNANGYDYHLIPGQMGYLKAELESGYPGVYQYLLNVPDTAQGAYDAAYFWCRYFEIPANVEYHSVMRAKLAQNEFFPRTLGVGSTEVEKEEEELLLEVDRGELFLSNWLFKNNSEASIQKIWEDTSMRSTQWTFEKQSWEISD
ncbi:MAG: phage tail tip lysozyme, partial [Eubacteriales bacterium]|nr:phage tail tip lysozyme [Eubacteriales bacterium]